MHLHRPAALALALAAAVGTASLTLGSRAATGADAYGYVSQAALWYEGRLVLPEPLARETMWPDTAATLAPLGYRAAPGGFGIVPTYAPGLPMLMAAARAAGGPCAMYLIVPLAAGLFVWLTYVLALRASDQVVAVGAAALAATSPPLLFMMMWPMTDVPVAVCWLAALVSATSRREQGRPVLTAILIGTAILIRPNLAPLTLVPGALVLWRAAAHGRSSLRRAALLFAGTLVPFIGAVAVFNTVLYGSPLESGYGRLSGLYAFSRVPTNGVLHLRWLYDSQGAYIFAFLAGVLIHLRRGMASPFTWGIALAALCWLAYLPYYTYFDWWYLRFLLPALPILYILSVDGVATLLGRIGPRVRLIATVAFVAAAAHHALTFALDKGVAGIGEDEHRYVEAALFVRDALPAGAVVLSGQHSGSVRYYSGRTTIRFEALDGHWLDRTVDILNSWRRPPYLLLEAWEERQFRDHFAGQRMLDAIDRAPVAELDGHGTLRIYDLSAPDDDPGRTARIPHLNRMRCYEPR